MCKDKVCYLELFTLLFKMSIIYGVQTSNSNKDILYFSRAGTRKGHFCYSLGCIYKCMHYSILLIRGLQFFYDCYDIWERYVPNLDFVYVAICSADAWAYCISLLAKNISDYCSWRLYLFTNLLPLTRPCCVCVFITVSSFCSVLTPGRLQGYRNSVTGKNKTEFTCDSVNFRVNFRFPCLVNFKKKSYLVTVQQAKHLRQYIWIL